VVASSDDYSFCEHRLCDLDNQPLVEKFWPWNRFYPWIDFSVNNIHADSWSGELQIFRTCRKTKRGTVIKYIYFKLNIIEIKLVY